MIYLTYWEIKNRELTEFLKIIGEERKRREEMGISPVLTLMEENNDISNPLG